MLAFVRIVSTTVRFHDRGGVGFNPRMRSAFRKRWAYATSTAYSSWSAKGQLSMGSGWRKTPAWMGLVKIIFHSLRNAETNEQLSQTRGIAIHTAKMVTIVHD